MVGNAEEDDDDEMFDRFMLQWSSSIAGFEIFVSLIFWSLQYWLWGVGDFGQLYLLARKSISNGIVLF